MSHCMVNFPLLMNKGDGIRGKPVLDFSLLPLGFWDGKIND